MTTENTMILDTTKGKVVIEMRPDLAPGHVARIKELVQQGFYDGSYFTASSTASWHKPAVRRGPAPAGRERSSRRNSTARRTSAAPCRWRGR